MNKEKYREFLETFIPSPEMREYLSGEDVWKYKGTVADIIKGAPVSLETKAKWLEGEDKLKTEEALRELHTSHPGEIFCFFEAWYDRDVFGEKMFFETPVSSYGKAIDLIRREIELLMKDKPVVASYGGYAASGGYLISAACKKIFTDNSTLTGSIGVFGMVPSLGRAMRKTFHVNPVTIGTNEHSTMGSGMKPLSKEEQAWYQEKIEGIYDSFVSTVAEGRSMTKEAVDSLAQGRVWSGKDALENGLADERGTLMDAVRYAADLAGLKKYRIETYPVKKEMSESLMEMLSGKETKKDDDLVKSLVKSYFAPGFHTIARMPEIKINNK